MKEIPDNYDPRVIELERKFGLGEGSLEGTLKCIRTLVGFDVAKAVVERTITPEGWNKELARIFSKNELLNGGLIGKYFVQTRPEYRNSVWYLFSNLGTVVRESLANDPELVERWRKNPEIVFGGGVENGYNWEAGDEVVESAFGELFGGDNGDVGFSCYEGGVAVQQVRIGSRQTCVLASMQMLMAHTRAINMGAVRRNPNFLLELKGEMMDTASKVVGEFVDESGAGTLKINTGTEAVKLMETLADQLELNGTGSRDRGKLWVVEPIKKGETIPVQALVLAKIAKEWSEGRNVVYMINNTVDLSRPGGEGGMLGGHEVLLTGVSRIFNPDTKKNEFWFRLLDPISGARFSRSDQLMRRMIGSGVIAGENSKGKLKKISLGEDDVGKILSRPRRGGKIVWG